MLETYSYEIIAGAVAVLAIIIYIVMQPKYKKFRNLEMYGANWKWKWKSGDVYALRCFCKNCEGELYFDDEIAKSSVNLNDKVTFLVCKNCDHKAVGKVQGGDRNYLLSLVKRQIHKKAKEI